MRNEIELITMTKKHYSEYSSFSATTLTPTARLHEQEIIFNESLSIGSGLKNNLHYYILTLLAIIPSQPVQHHTMQESRQSLDLTLKKCWLHYANFFKTHTILQIRISYCKKNADAISYTLNAFMVKSCFY